jgi:hypothetical protein
MFQSSNIEQFQSIKQYSQSVDGLLRFTPVAAVAAAIRHQLDCTLDMP